MKVLDRAKPTDDRQRRRRSESEVKAGEYRTPGELDRDRILYSSEFRRLSGITQITSVSERRLLHTRLTHSLKVGQIGRRMAQQLWAEHPEWAENVGLDADVVEAAGLAHDLGHPPFGHVAEERLNYLLKDHGGFEGNAHTFRILTKLAIRREEELGLDLTKGTLAAVLKYPKVGAESVSAVNPWTDRSRGTKWGAYKTERADFDFARLGLEGDRRTVEAILMDWADDVSFATHDIDDYFRAGLIPLHALENDWTFLAARASARLASKHGASFDTAKFGKALDTLRGLPFDRPFGGTRTDSATLHTFISGKITEFLAAVQPLDTPPFVQITDRAQYEVEALKELTWFYVIERPALATLQEGQKVLIERLFEVLLGWLSKDHQSPRVPQQLREIFEQIDADADARNSLGDEYDREYCLRRAVCDYVCSLTEMQALDMHERIAGGTPASMFGTWFA